MWTAPVLVSTWEGVGNVMFSLICKGICLIVWAFFMLMWMRIAATGEIKKQGIPPSFLLPLLIIAFFAVSFIFPIGWTFIIFTIIGLVLFFAGVFCSFWAKVTLEDNWVSGNALITGHELVKEAPYSIVRHPFYFAISLMCLGSAFIFGSLSMLAATVVMTLLLSLMAILEERMLLEEFGTEYTEYQEQVPFIIPPLTRWISGLSSGDRE